MKENELRNEIKKLEVTKEHIQKVVDNIQYNIHFGKYYKKLANETDNDLYLRKFDRLADCNNVWEVDHYKEQKIFDFKKTNLCRDKFCNNCKKVRQASKLGKFKPLLMPYKENMFQMTLTIPNMPGAALSDAIDKLFKAYAQLIGYLKGKKKVKGIDFTVFNYQGSIRSLEVTIPKKDEYHPHLHALVVLEGYEGWKHLKHENQYSHNRKNKKEIRLFSDEEILLQKIWYLAVNGETVTKANIDKLPVGYSCRIDKFREDDFLELFKYMTKSTTEYDKVLSYSQFKTLYYALDGRRQIQGYGCFYNIKDDDEVDPAAVEEYYNQIVAALQQKEKPVEVWETPADLLKVTKETDSIVISRKKVHKHLKDVMLNQ